MKGTRHNGRSGKDGVYNPLHNDRRFDPEHSEHIDNERVRQNIYWDCYQGYTTMADRGKEDNFSFNQIEMAWIRRSLAGREPESTDFQRKDMADREAGSGKEQKKRVATNRIKMDLQS